MAERRMFAKTIIDSDAFLDMPCSTQCLYFHLSMRADDDGFINSPKKIQRMIGCSDDDLRLLAAKKFIIPFQSGVVVIKHWKIHNYIRNDRYKPTVYQEELSELELKENGVYTIGIPSDNQMETQDRIGKDRIGKVSIEGIVPEAQSPKEESRFDYEIFRRSYNGICSKLPECRTVTEKRKKAIRLFSKELSVEEWTLVCQKANESGFLTGENDRKWKADIDFLLRVDKATKVLEGTYDHTSAGNKKEPIWGGQGPGEAELDAIRQLMEGT